MVVNPDKFQAIILDKQKSYHINERITVDNQQTKIMYSLKLLGLQLDDKLNFNLHISNICKSAANLDYCLVGFWICAKSREC